MPRTTPKAPEPKTLHTTLRARQLAREAADRSFEALAAEIRFDEAPGDVDLIAACIDIENAILKMYSRGQSLLVSRLLAVG